MSLGLAACAGPESTPSVEVPVLTAAEEAAARAELSAWREQRLESLLSSGSWLTLAGLHWLEPGRQAVGHGAEVDLPAPAPEQVGALEVEEGVVTFVAASDAAVRTGTGRTLEPGERLVLRSDAAGAPTRLSLGPISFHLIERGERIGVRVRNEESEVRTTFQGIDHFATDLGWRLEGRYEPYLEGKRLDVPSVLGDTTEEDIPGSVTFERAGETYRLDALYGGDESEVFLLFGDGTNGFESYGGGRFLYATVEGPLDQAAPVILDFNQSYNPPCAFTPFATCPLPPPSNVLALRIEAGEKSYGDGH